MSLVFVNNLAPFLLHDVFAAAQKAHTARLRHGLGTRLLTSPPPLSPPRQQVQIMLFYASPTSTSAVDELFEGLNITMPSESDRSESHPPIQLPVEICGHIFEFLTNPGDLSRVCLSSRTFHDEASRLLYRSINLENVEARIAYTHAVIEYPYLGERVISLKIPLEGEDDDYLPEVFPLLTNLQSLCIPSLDSADGNTFPEDHFRQTTFRLRSFHNHTFRIQGTFDFLSKQPELVEWTQEQISFYPKEGFTLPTGFLPNLHTMSIDAEVVFAFTTIPPVTRLKIRFWHLTADEELRTYKNLGRFRGALTNLCLHHWDADNPFVARVVLGMLAEETPGIKHLCLVGFNVEDFDLIPSPHQVGPSFFEVLSTILPLLPHLETFLWIPRDEPESSITYKISDEEVQDLTQFLTVFPRSLTAFVFAVGWNGRTHELASYGKDPSGVWSRRTERPVSVEVWGEALI
ncbi:hypothetical protein JAAARDRAFT_206617 [Jaapia argillacea MUCL 33604]|uniref:F-box domain-containing protein n=1 Tax=Jaapia argillacea MUCL 33604 TaxID=933084 RepID=A0A067PY16_9AGAM|nr:hypothetical protein JAAARDRAFT_206617 [Jaapia argillacea MUCL 33604]